MYLPFCHSLLHTCFARVAIEIRFAIFARGSCKFSCTNTLSICYVAGSMPTTSCCTLTFYGNKSKNSASIIVFFILHLPISQLGPKRFTLQKLQFGSENPPSHWHSPVVGAQMPLALHVIFALQSNDSKILRNKKKRGHTNVAFWTI